MKTAVLKSTPGSGGLRFEVHSTPSRGHHNAQKWYMKANHPVEASRWIQALTKSIEWSRTQKGDERRSADSEVSSLAPPGSLRTPSLSHSHLPSKNVSGNVSTASSIAGDETAEGGDGGGGGVAAWGERAAGCGLGVAYADVVDTRWNNRMCLSEMRDDDNGKKQGVFEVL